MKSTETKSLVLLKHHLKQLRLPSIHDECEKLAARCAQSIPAKAILHGQRLARYDPRKAVRQTTDPHADGPRQQRGETQHPCSASLPWGALDNTTKASEAILVHISLAAST